MILRQLSGKNPSFRKVLTKIFNTFPITVYKPYPHYLSNLSHTTGGTTRLEKRVITFSYLIISDWLFYRILLKIKMTLHSCFSKQLPPSYVNVSIEIKCFSLFSNLMPLCHPPPTMMTILASIFLALILKMVSLLYIQYLLKNTGW